MPVVTEGAAADSPESFPPPPGMGEGAETEVDEDDDADAPRPPRKRLRPEQRPIFKVLVLVAILALVGGVVGGGYYAFTILTAVPPPPELVERPKVVPAGPTPEEKAAQAEAQAAADAAAAAALATAQAEAKAAIAAEKAAAEAAEGPPPPPVIPDPSAEFVAWVEEVKIGGVREGANPRVFINGRTINLGEMVDLALEISFDSLDAQRNLVIFKDATGAMVAKKF